MIICFLVIHLENLYTAKIVSLQAQTHLFKIFQRKALNTTGYFEAGVCTIVDIGFLPIRGKPRHIRQTHLETHHETSWANMPKDEILQDNTP